MAGIFSSDPDVVAAAADYLKSICGGLYVYGDFLLLYGILQWYWHDKICDGAGNHWSIRRAGTGILSDEYPAESVAVSYRTGNADVICAAAGAVPWLYVLFKKAE